MRKESSQNKNESARSKKNFFFPDSSFFFFSYDTRIQSGFLDFDHKIEIRV